MLDAFHNFFDRHAVGFAHVAAEAVDDLQPFLRHRAGTVHHQMRVGNAFVNFFDAIDVEDVASGRTAEFICAVRGADGDGQGVHFGFLNKIGGFFRVGQKLGVI